MELAVAQKPSDFSFGIGLSIIQSTYFIFEKLMKSMGFKSYSL
jgi:hypothetical protein